ncbi:MAG: hypothetical protein BA867_06450 [Desulfobacterales bacterium S5133MH16]|nr:MAG: hypothetical protein BA867_06450 [Desulfobacterales bacterium S5133MH16]
MPKMNIDDKLGNYIRIVEERMEDIEKCSRYFLHVRNKEYVKDGINIEQSRYKDVQEYVDKHENSNSEELCDQLKHLVEKDKSHHCQKLLAFIDQIVEEQISHGAIKRIGLRSIVALKSKLKEYIEETQKNKSFTPLV